MPLLATYPDGVFLTYIWTNNLTNPLFTDAPACDAIKRLIVYFGPLRTSYRTARCYLDRAGVLQKCRMNFISVRCTQSFLTAAVRLTGGDGDRVVVRWDWPWRHPTPRSRSVEFGPSSGAECVSLPSSVSVHINSLKIKVRYPPTLKHVSAKVTGEACSIAGWTTTSPRRVSHEKRVRSCFAASDFAQGPGVWCAIELRRFLRRCPKYAYRVPDQVAVVPF